MVPPINDSYAVLAMLLALKSRTESLLTPGLRAWLPYVLLGLAVFLSYINVYGNKFVFDDDLLISMNDWLRDWDHLGDIITGSTTGGVHIVGGFFRPMQILLYWVVFHINELDPFFFHALNVLLHLANTCLMYKLGTKLGFNRFGAFAASLIWAVHPVHTEAVTYMSATADPLFAFFCLLGVIYLLPDFTFTKILRVIPIFLLGLVSKETTAMFPLLVMVTLFFVSPDRLKPRTYLRTWPLWVIALAYVWWRAVTPGFDGPQTYDHYYQFEGFSNLKEYALHPTYRFYTFLATLPNYAQLLVWPTHLHMERVFQVENSLWSGVVLVGLILFGISAAQVVYSGMRSKYMALSWGLLWFGAAHAPDTGLLVPMNALFLEHWMYLPSVGLFLGIAETAVAALQNRPRWMPNLATGLVAIAASALSIATLQQNAVWSNPKTFYTNIFNNGVSSARAHNNLALYYADQKQLREAIDEFTKAVSLVDAYAETRYNMALVYLQMSEKNTDLAIANLKRSLEIQPNFYRSYQALGDVYQVLLHDKAKGDEYHAKAQELFGQQQ